MARVGAGGGATGVFEVGVEAPFLDGELFGFGGRGDELEGDGEGVAVYDGAERDEVSRLFVEPRLSDERHLSTLETARGAWDGAGPEVGDGSVKKIGRSSCALGFFGFFDRGSEEVLLLWGLYGGGFGFRDLCRGRGLRLRRGFVR